MQSIDSPEIDSKVQRSLEGTAFAASVLEKLSGGSVNWTYYAKLSKELDGGPAEVAIKHGERHMASKPEFELNLHRCGVEVECLRSLSGSSFVGNTDATSSYSFTVRTPKLFHFDEENTNQIQEYMPNGIDLKNYILQHYPAPTPVSLKPQCYQIGKALGRWLKGFMEWNEDQPKLRRKVAENKFAQQIKHMINFAWLSDRVKEFPEVVGNAKDILEEVEKMAAAEALDESKFQTIHGDFWTGNVLLSNTPLREGSDIPMFIIDWECAQLGLPSMDFGQMMAEQYALWLYKSITAGLWMMEGLIDAYGNISEDFAFRAAIQMGAHLLCTTTTFPGWGTSEQVEDVAGIGKDIIVHAWKKDRSWFQQGELACLFSHVT